MEDETRCTDLNASNVDRGRGDRCHTWRFVGRGVFVSFIPYFPVAAVPWSLGLKITHSTRTISFPLYRDALAFCHIRRDFRRLLL